MTEQPRSRNVKPTTKKSTKKQGKKKRFSFKRMFIFLFFSAALAVICGIIGYLFIILNGERILTANQDKLILPEASHVYDINGNEIASLYNANDARENVSLDEIPELLRQAFIATEDQRFYQHSGIDYFSLGRAAVKDIIARSKVEGGSTITQQLAKNIFLTADKTFFRKATEASIAIALENNKTKDEILEMYLNRIYFGKGVYGIKQASEYYFGKEPKDLELWQMATLAGMPKAPNRYNPINDPEASQTRREVVLKLMYDQGYITAEQRNEAVEAEYKPEMSNDKVNPQLYPAFVDFVVDEAVEKSGISEEELRIGGYKIYTTLNPVAQNAVEKQFADDANFEQSPDDIKVQGSMIIIDHRNGEIQAIAGGRDYKKKTWNRVTKSRQPGSSFKPIAAYGPALETGKFTPDSTLRDDKQCFGDYCPSDSNSVKYVGAISMKQAIKESRNLPAVWLLDQIGVDKGLEFAKKLGFELSPEDRNLAIALGGLTNGVSPLQMATAYSVFANDGKSVDPHTVKSIDNRNDDPVYTYHAPRAKQLIKQSTAAGLTEIMLGVTEPGGTGTKAKLDRPVAGKTGTTQHGFKDLKSSANRDVWFVGYTPEWTAAVWMGYDKTDKQHLLQKSSGQAAAMFGKVMSEAMKNVPRGSFNKAPVREESEPEKNVEVPEQVTGLHVEYDADSYTAKLSWKPVKGEGITYRLYRKETNEANFSRLIDTAAGTTTAEDMSVAPGLSYQYYVTAYNAEADLESTPSAAVALNVPPEELEKEPPTGEPATPDIIIPGDEATTPEEGEATPDNGKGKGNGNGKGSGNGKNNNGGNNGNDNGNGVGNGDSTSNNNGTEQGEGTAPGDTVPGGTIPDNSNPDGSGSGGLETNDSQTPVTNNSSESGTEPIIPDVVVPSP
ncbi:penicillin-binding protein 1A [Paenibacillus xylaniclasticus]|uniref:penicillin-binding protein 1A n=1 Tax=Paenibacillus xylaniclasticus TaxID=588083 RepID=UPI000FD9AD9E|nr:MULTISPECIES: penicillin-binding protein 1A [Paenibacillus]GFN30797.1 penicillin-binding protein 1F [Paenibacillus curdlanolyticus]